MFRVRVWKKGVGYKQSSRLNTMPVKLRNSRNLQAAVSSTAVSVVGIILPSMEFCMSASDKGRSCTLAARMRRKEQECLERENHIR
jgi:hypothetical protein